MTPVVPEENPPVQSIVATFGFHLPHVDMSDQMRQTLSGAAEVSTDVPYSRAIPLTYPARLRAQLSTSFNAAGCGTSAAFSLVQLRTRITAINSPVPTSWTPYTGWLKPHGGGADAMSVAATG